ncbi:right-handed parallel beta-helix repeat-containing protein [Jiangella endophytica]|uniref:right-handed parallel beta-helix repeat-containing protein n=1 Tax=Jiangella endophytica TaxID=1623398 RepID=UPI001300323A|nr:right-handed parallel beta-helix repeat-containing protein [Jiangella endophytica]
MKPTALEPGSFVTPQQFGAAGNGTTDDTAAVQAAIDSVVGRGDQKIVVLPPGAYLISAPLRVSSRHGRMKLLGYGTMATRTSQISLGFDGPAIQWEGTLGHVEGVAFVAVGQRTSGMIGVLVKKSANADDMDFLAASCNFTSMQVAVRQEGRGLYFIQNLVALGGTGVEVSWPQSGVEGGGPHVPPYGLRKWMITGNHFHTPTDFAIKFHGESDGQFRGAIITDNLLDIGRRLFWGSLTNSTIAGNIVENSSRTDGWDGTPPAPIVHITSGGHGVTISGNHFGGFEVPPGGEYTPDWQGIWQMGERAVVFGPDAAVHHTTITGNTISWVWGTPLHVEGSLSDSTITANTFEGWNQSGTAGEAAVRIDGDATRVSLTGNAFGENPAGEPPIRVGGSLRQGSVVGNTYAGSSPLVAGGVEGAHIELLPCKTSDLPAPAGLTGATVVVTDARGQRPSLAVSDGTSWLVSPPGRPV